jgi:Rhodopirellula transposase DDE domain
MSENEPGLVPELKRLVEPATLGEPMWPLDMGLQQHGQVCGRFVGDGAWVNADTVARELAKLGFSRQLNRKAEEDPRHPDRDAQFEHINAKVVAVQ